MLQCGTAWYGLLQFVTACYSLLRLVTLLYCLLQWGTAFLAFLQFVTACYNMANLKKIDFAQTLLFGRVISPKNCYAVGFIKYCVIIGKNANFEPEPNFGGFSSADCAFNRPKSTNNLFDWPFLCCLCQFDKGYLITSLRDNFFPLGLYF